MDEDDDNDGIVDVGDDDDDGDGIPDESEDEDEDGVSNDGKYFLTLYFLKC